MSADAVATVTSTLILVAMGINLTMLVVWWIGEPPATRPPVRAEERDGEASEREEDPP